MTKTHEMSKTRIYRIWKGMRRRCLNKRDYAYPDYGGRGIVICKEWDSFEKFYEDMISTYNDNLSIDRIDNDGNYCKENCRWVSRKIQNSNKRTNVRYLIDGEYLILWEIAEKYKIGHKRLKARIERLNKTIYEAIAMGNNKPKYYSYDRRMKKYRVFVSKDKKNIKGGYFSTEREAKIKVKEILKKQYEKQKN